MSHASGESTSGDHALADCRWLPHPGPRYTSMDETRFHTLLHRPGGTLVDAGAHDGLLTLPFARLPDSRVLAFEPLPPAFARLEAALRAGFGGTVPPHVALRNAALGDRAGEVTLAMPVLDGVAQEQWASTAKDYAAFAGARLTVARFTVPLLRLDDLALADLTAMKIDVEGAELGVLRGGVETIRRGRPTMVVESVGKGPARFGYTHADLFSFLDGELQYDLHRPRGFIQNGAPLSLEAFMRYHEYPFGAFNYIAAPRPDARTAAQAD